MTDPAALVVRGVTKTFGRTVALANVSLEVPQGCIFGLIGPNGSGKTTLIRIALDLLRPTSGTVEVLGHDSRRAGVQARRLSSYLPGNLVLPPKLTGGQYLADVARIRGVSPNGEVAALAERLDADLGRPIGHLSLGNRRKIGLIAALAHSPRLVFLDEPTGGMDPLVQQTFRHLVRESTQRGATVFLSSHVLDEVQHVSDRIAVVRQGSIVTTGSVDQLTTRLTRTFTVTFSTPVSQASIGPTANVVGVAAGTHDKELIFSVRGTAGDLFTRLAAFHPIDIRGSEPDLEDAFLDLYRTPA
jgi:ABC-2 type transport system ATP-binding protein